MGPERQEVALSDAPQVAAEEMSDATDRLREQAWMVAPLTSGVVDPRVTADVEC